MTKLSVVIPIYNAEKYIEKCLLSVMHQDVTDIEIICVLDGATDNSERIVRNMQTMDDRIIIISNDINRGQSYSRNVGIKKATGKYSLFLDADDFIDNKAFGLLIKNADERELDVLGFNLYQIYEDKPQQTLKAKSKEEKVCSGIEFFLDGYKTGYHMVTCTYMYRTDFLIGNSIYFINGIFYEDNIFYLDCMFKAQKVGYVDKALYCYRRHLQSTSMTRVDRIKHFESMCVVIDYILNKIDKENDRIIIQALQKMASGKILYAYKLYSEIESFPTSYIPKFSQVDKVLPFIQTAFRDGYYPYKFDEQTLMNLRKADKILIYGRGKLGIAMEKLLNEVGITNYSFVITKRQNDNDIDEITDWIDSKDRVSVIVASSIYSEEMAENAKKLGFDKVIVPRFYF
ncbi:glycosyltransferase [Butyrivibrio sp. AC2005]|uniref:glycosyltransferase n=1 Tax=Butyrivibrio sp. AC2005 TaxID=1280672 RepID=UPI00042500F5|nr:glycosyltransferase [Butyrivibrio sp. AC2005]